MEKTLNNTILIFVLHSVLSNSQANMDILRRAVANTVSAGCKCSFSLDRLALTVDQCPYGKPSDNMAMMRGWIYDTSDSPDQKYFPYLQRMASIIAGDMKVWLPVSVAYWSNCTSSNECLLALLVCGMGTGLVRLNYIA